MNECAGFVVGQTVELPDGRIGTVRFVGTTHFAAGGWIGIELEDPSGKNDGAVLGERYFDCEPNYGMFIKPEKAVVIAQPEPAQNVQQRTNTNISRVNVGNSKTRPASSLLANASTRRGSVLDAATLRRQSINAATPTPVSRGRQRSLVSPTKQLRSGASTGNAASRTSSIASKPGPSRPTNARPTRMSISSTTANPTTTRAHRPSIVGKPGHLSHPPSARVVSTRVTDRPGGSRRSLSNSSSGESGVMSRTTSHETLLHRAVTGDVHNRNSTLSHPPNPRAIHSPPKAPSRTVSGANLAAAQQNAALAKDLEDVKAKLRVTEKRRDEDREKLKALEKAQEERDRFEAIIQKLQAKYQPQQQELADLRKQIKEAENRIEELEHEQAEHETELEMATLDREMAEEMAEATKTELDAFKQKSEELELEVEVLKEENEELSHVMSPEEKTSQGWLQMERQNDRLREALLRLRDITQQTEADLKDQVKELQDDLQELSGIKQQYNSSQEKVTQLESNCEDLRQQLDTALGAEEMIEDLTETNMRYQEEMDQLRATIEDLECLKELNDELEVNHVEAEKQLQEEIDFKDSVLNEQVRRMVQQDEAIEELEYTLSRFRELVSNLQTDLEDMRASQQITETEASELNNRSRAVLDLNLKLQASASKAQIKTIDLELGRLEAQESSDQLAIVQLFLPETFESEKDGVNSYLRFKRIGWKAKLISMVVHERIGDGRPQIYDNLFAAYDVLDKLAWVSTMCNRFVSYASGCTTAEFSKLSGAFYDLEPVERAMNAWIADLKKDEMKEKEVGDELARTMSLISDLAEKSIAQTAASQADDVHAQSVIMQGYLDNAAAAFTQIKNTVQATIQASEEDEEALHFNQMIEQVISTCRSGKVIAAKISRALEEFKKRHLSFKEDQTASFQSIRQTTQDLSRFARAFGEAVFNLLHSPPAESGSETVISSPTYTAIATVFGSLKSPLFRSSEPTLALLLTTLTDLAKSLSSIHGIVTDLSLTTEFETHPAPWTVRAREIAQSKVISPDIHEQLTHLKEDLTTKSRTVALKEKSLEESAIRIELLESRMKDAQAKSVHVHDLENTLAGMKVRERELADILDSQAKDLQAIESDRDRWRKVAEENKNNAVLVASTTRARRGTGVQHAAMLVATEKQMQALREEINSLESAIRFLRLENHQLRFPPSPFTTSSSMQFLVEPLTPPQTPTQQRDELLALEAKDTLNELLKLATESPSSTLVDLSKSIRKREERGKWRSLTDGSNVKVARQREKWEGWKEWVNDVIDRSKTGGGPRTRTVSVGGMPIKQNDAAAVTDGVQVVDVETGQVPALAEDIEQL